MIPKTLCGHIVDGQNFGKNDEIQSLKVSLFE